MGPFSKDNLITIVLAAGLVLAGWMLVYRPQGRELERVRAAVLTEKTSLESCALEASVVPALEREIRELRARYQDFDRRMPKRKELAGFYRNVSAILSSAQLSVEITEPGKVVREPLYNRQPIIMKFRGPYLSLGKVLERIDDMERLTGVEKLLITNDGDQDALSIEVQMNISFTET